MRVQLYVCSKELLFILFFDLCFLCITFTGKEKMTMNVHLLQHLPFCVRQFGPLWSFSCFAFENLNGFLSGCIHGNRYIPQQVCFIIIKKFHAAYCFRPIIPQVDDIYIYGMKFKLTLEIVIDKRSWLMMALLLWHNSYQARACSRNLLDVHKSVPFKCSKNQWSLIYFI